MTGGWLTPRHLPLAPTQPAPNSVFGNLLVRRNFQCVHIFLPGHVSRVWPRGTSVATWGESVRTADDISADGWAAAPGLTVSSHASSQHQCGLQARDTAETSAGNTHCSCSQPEHQFSSSTRVRYQCTCRSSLCFHCIFILFIDDVTSSQQPAAREIDGVWTLATLSQWTTGSANKSYLAPCRNRNWELIALYQEGMEGYIQSPFESYKSKFLHMVEARLWCWSDGCQLIGSPRRCYQADWDTWTHTWHTDNINSTLRRKKQSRRSIATSDVQQQLIFSSLFLSNYLTKLSEI